MKKFKIPPCQNHSLSPRVGKRGAGPCGPFGVRASRSANPIASRRAHPANASPLLRAFQPVTCRFPMLLWLEETSSRPPLPKADLKCFGGICDAENVVQYVA